MSNTQQSTIAAPISFKGVGLHTGKRHIINLLPAPVNSGIVFRRVDKKGEGVEIPANWHLTKQLPLCTCLVAENVNKSVLLSI